MMARCAALLASYERAWQMLDRWLLTPGLRVGAALMIWWLSDADFIRTQSLRDMPTLPPPLDGLTMAQGEPFARQLAPVLAVMLGIGLLTRLAAFLTLGIAVVLSLALFLPADLMATAQVLPSLWRQPAILPNVLFIALLLVVLARGGGALSIDHWMQRAIDRDIGNDGRRQVVSVGPVLLGALFLIPLLWLVLPDWSLLLASIAALMYFVCRGLMPR